MFLTLRQAALALLTGFHAANSHMIMLTPTPFGGSGLDNSPLQASGVDYPCKVKGDPVAFFDRTTTPVTKMAIGSTQTLSFKGSAVHGGGSCQLAITKDLVPSKSTHYSVILSIIGGCPSVSGDGPSMYDFQVPAGVVPGEYTFVWHWESKLAGQPEYYSNCSPIEITAGSAKRDLNVTINNLTRRDSLPDMFVANINGVNDCRTAPETDPDYPEPGAIVQRPPGSRNYQKPTGFNCCAEGKCVTNAISAGPVTAPPASAGNSSNSSAPSNAASGFASGVSVVPTQPQDSSMPTSASDPASSFVTSVVPPSSAMPLYPNTTTIASGAATSVASVPASNSTVGGLSGPCTSEGMFNCIGSSYQQCASGSWTLMHPLAAGTACKQGQSIGLWARKVGSFKPRRVI